MQALSDAMTRRGHPLARSDLERALAALTSAGFLVDGADDTAGAARNQIAYLEQHARTSAEARAMQGRIEAAHVVVLGAGGVGSWLSLAVAMLGVARLTVIDPDRVERANLGRQPYAQAAIGRRKVEALGLLARERNPRLRYEGVAHAVESAVDLAALVATADVVCCCADDPSPAAMAELVAAACIPRRIAHVAASYQGPVVRVGPTWTPRRRRVACAGCLAVIRERQLGQYGPTDAEVIETRREGRPTPVTVSQSMLAAALCVDDVLRVLAGDRPATTNRAVTIDQRTLRIYRTRIAPQPTCHLCRDGAQRAAKLTLDPQRR